MKLPRTLGFLVPLPFFFSASCNKDEPAAETQEVAAEAVEKVEEAVEKVLPGPSMSAEERAAMLGFAGRLSPDADLFMAIYDGAGMVRSLGELDTWAFIRKMVEEQEGVDPQEQIAQGAGEAEPFLGTEMFLAFGDGTAEQAEAAFEIQSRMSYYQFRMMSRAFAEGAASGDIAGAMSSLDDEAWIGGLARDIGRYMPLIEGAEIPPVLAGLRITDEEQMGIAEQQLRDLLGMAAEGSEPVEFDAGGASFSGNLYKGETLAEAAEGDREEMDEMLGEENADKILAALREKTLVATVGRLDDYLLVYLGSSGETCPVVPAPGDSLAAADEIGYIDGFKDKKVHGFFHVSEGLLAANVRTGLKEIAEGCRDGIKGVEGFGETRELIALLDMVGAQEQALLDFYDPAALGGVISLDGGARFDLFGGGDAGALDYEAPHRLGGLGQGEEVLFFANWTGNEAYAAEASKMGELLVEIAYATAAHLSSMEVESEELAQIKGGFDMFDQMFRSDLMKLWQGLSALESGLANETAVVIDLEAGFPPIPEVPKGIVDNGRFLRASLVAPVEDRAKLGESWKMVQESVVAMLATAKEMGAPEFHMPPPTNSQMNDVVTWYFDAFSFSDDLKPSVTVSDDWFVASTSRTQALDLLERAGTEDEHKGMWAKLDLEVLRKYLAEAVKLVDEHGEDLLGSDIEGFREMMPVLLEGLASLEEFDAVTVHDRMEGDMRRVTLHFEME